jgi:hypothetical protein
MKEKFSTYVALAIDDQILRFFVGSGIATHFSVRDVTHEPSVGQ